MAVVLLGDLTGPPVYQLEHLLSGNVASYKGVDGHYPHLFGSVADAAKYAKTRGEFIIWEARPQ
jgi:hypothetical protein